MICTRTSICREEKFQTRAENENKDLYIEGYFAVFGAEYQIWDGIVETVAPSAFDGETGGDVRALANHDSTLVLGRTIAGTLTLRVDDRGLWGSIKINPADQDAMNLYERVKRGDVSQCSFGFDILKESQEERADGSVLFTIEKVKLYEVSVCTFPAYEATGVQARQQTVADIKKRKLDVWKIDMRRKLKGEFDNA